MRIIAGQYRGRILKSPTNLKIRPTSDRLRETLFNILNSKINDQTRLLDLCAGTGAVGIEAISRGAAFATFVDKSRKSCGLIESNLDSLGIAENLTEVFQSSAEDFLRRNEDKSWDIIFYDPPYTEDYQKIFSYFGDSERKILSGDGVFVAEHHSKNILPDLVGDLRRWRVVRQGDSSLSFYEKN